jgi:hypothetical protein
MHNSDSVKYSCRVCGWTQKDPPWGDDGLSPTFEICDCCGVEFGYEDRTASALIEFRSLWLASGLTWFNNSKMPVNWDLRGQLAKIGVLGWPSEGQTNQEQASTSCK